MRCPTRLDGGGSLKNTGARRSGGPPSGAPDTFYADLLRWLARLVGHPLYRPFTHLSRNPRQALAAVVLRRLLLAGLVAPSSSWRSTGCSWGRLPTAAAAIPRSAPPAPGR